MPDEERDDCSNCGGEDGEHRRSNQWDQDCPGDDGDNDRIDAAVEADQAARHAARRRG